MTKKHFVALAHAISQIADPVNREEVARLVAVLCSESNPNFDFGRFYAACNVDYR